MAVMKPFELVFELGSNITLRNHAIHLDGLLSNACYRHTGCSEKALTLLDDLLLFDAKHRMYHGSAMAFGVTPEQSITARTRHYVGVMRLRDDTLLPSKISPSGTEQYRKITVNGGPERSRLNKYQAFYSPYLVFHGVGDIERIDRLVQFHCSRLGVNANSGSGTVNHVAIKEIDQDFSCIDAHGQIARNLPVSWLKARQNTGSTLPPDTALNLDNGETLPVCAPYWHSHHRFTTTEAVAVEKIRRVVI